MACFPGQAHLANPGNMGLNAKQAKQGVGGAQFASYEERAAGGGEVLYGLDAELAAKAAAKYDHTAEHQCRMWIEAVTGDKLGEGSLQEELKNGIVLCHLVNAISPAISVKPSTSKMPFKQMENISMYLDACTKLGVPAFSSFQTVALYENKDMMAVINNIQALGSVAQKVPGYNGPILGAKISDAAPREFTQEQLRKGSAAQTFMGKGSHGHASQAGMTDRNKEINKMGHVQGAEGLGSAEPTFIGTGSHGNATASGMSRHHEIVRSNLNEAPPPPMAKRNSGTITTEAKPKRSSGAGLGGGGIMAGSTGLANQSMCRPAPNSQGQGQAVFRKFDDAADGEGNVNYGLDADLAAKAAAKYDSGLEGECRGWIEAVTGDKLGSCTLQEELKDGVVLCNVINAIAPGMSLKPSTSKMPFKQMENISMYLDACTKLGVSGYDMFQTVALYENKDMMAVLTNIQSLGRVAQAKGYKGPALGAKLATANVRNFTEEQLAAGLNTATFLGTGSHGQANAAGMIDRSKEINRMGHVGGVDGLGSADPTFLGTGSHGGATASGMGRHHEIVRSNLNS